MLCCDPAGAQDLVQDTVERTLRFASRFEPGTNLQAWMSRILVNVHLSGRRRANTERRALEWLGADPHAWTRPDPTPPMLGFSPMVAGAFASLPRHHAAVVRLVDLYDYSYSDAAEKLQVPIGTVMSRLHRARRRLAAALAANSPRERTA